jgi:5-methylcytosine-specific restriction endonuclease McrA
VNVKASDLREMVESQGYLCNLTGRPLTPKVASVDHCLPLSRGGTNEPHNLQVLHKDVNFAKGTMTTSEFIELCTEVVNHVEKNKLLGACNGAPQKANR